MKTKAIICDLDGTLALFQNVRGPYDTKDCEKDEPNVPIVKLLEMLIRNAIKDELTIILVSGRMDEHKEATKRWLAKYEIPYDALYMRKSGDKRSDPIVKRELFENNIKDKYDVWFVLDDRPRVVRMWRHELGLTVFQLNDKEF